MKNYSICSRTETHQKHLISGRISTLESLWKANQNMQFKMLMIVSCCLKEVSKIGSPGRLDLIYTHLGHIQYSRSLLSLIPLTIEVCCSEENSTFAIWPDLKRQLKMSKWELNISTNLKQLIKVYRRWVKLLVNLLKVREMTTFLTEIPNSLDFFKTLQVVTLKQL